MLRYYAFLAAVVLLGLAIALLRPSPALSDTDLTGLLNTTFLPRTTDASLHALAHERAQYQVTYSGGFCGEGSLTHDGSTGAEVLACNYEGPEKTVQQWLGSAPHAAILLDPSLTLIGCGSAPGDDGATFWACTLSAGSQPTPAPIPVAPAPPVIGTGPGPTPVPLVLLLPDTRTR